MIFNPFHISNFKATKLPQWKVLNAYTRFLLTFLFLLALLARPESVKAQVSGEDYEEISVFLAVQGIGGYDITAIYKNDQIYLPIADMFQVLKINQKTSEFNDTISGFFLDENNKYIISQPSHSIFINGKLIQLSEDELLNTETSSLALRLDLYGKLFGLDCKFNFSSLSVELKTNLELPVIKELRLEQMRKNISRLRGEIKVDTTYKRRYHLFRGGMADWAIYSTQITGGTTVTRASLGLGAEFLGGETNIELSYSTQTHFDKRQQLYHWRWANNDTKLVKQITVGKINSQSIASIYSPLIGTVITNAPTSFRRSFGSYTMSDFTEPGWTVELYINNVVVDYTTADAKGFYKFDIPLVYGSSNVEVKFYGPWGEERLKKQTINVPYTFMPKGEMQYTVAGAMVDDSTHSLFTRAETNFGVTRHLTLGGGFEYLSSIISAPSIPFVTGSAQLFNNFLVNGEYAYGVRTKALFSYSSPSDIVFDIDYAKYAEEQKAIIFNYLEERKVRVSIPISINKFTAYSRFSFIQNILKETNYSTAEATLSTYVKGVSANFTANANWIKDKEPYIYGNLALGFRFFHTLSFRPQVQYDFTNNDPIFTKVELEENFSPRCNLSLMWENNIRSNINTVELTFKYDLAFVQTSFNTRISKDYIMTGQSARGSFAFGSGNGKVIADIRTQVGRAGVTVIPFLDINNNNRRDDNEPITTGMDLRINGGRILSDAKDSIIRILDLEPFASYMLEFSDTQFDNIAWQIKNKTVSILMDPNQFKLLEVPVKIMGEINGMVFIKTGSGTKAQGRILVNIFDENGNFVAKTSSESDGFYTYLGLAPGRYHAEIDSMQLTRLKYVSQPKQFDFEIFPSVNGDIIDNVEFVLLRQGIEKLDPAKPEQKKVELQPVAKIEIPVTEKVEIPVIVKETEKIEPVIKEAVVTKPAEITSKPTESHKYFIQAGAFIKPKNAERLMKDLSKRTSEKWFIVKEGDFYKVRLGYFDSKEVADNLKENLDTPEMAYYISEIPVNATTEYPYMASENAQPKQAIAKETELTKQAQAKETEQAKQTIAKETQTKQAQAKEAELAKQTLAKATDQGIVTNNESVIIPSMDCEDSLHPQTGYFVQAGAFAIKSNAEKLTAKLIATTGQNWFIACGKGLYKVRLGYFATKKEATDLGKTIKGTGIALYVNKPKGLIIKDQPVNVTEIAAEKQKAQTVPVQIPEVKEKKVPEPVIAQTVPVQTPAVKEEKASEQGIPKPVEKAVIIPPVAEKLPEPEKTVVKAAKKSKDGIVLAPPIDELIAAEPVKYYIQAGAFDSKEHAERLTQHLLGLTLKRWFIVYENGLYKVRLGYFTTKEAAKSVEGTLNTTEVPYYVGGVIPGAVQKNNNSGDREQKRKPEAKENLPDKKQDTKPASAPKPEDTKTIKQEEPNINKNNGTDAPVSKTAAKETEKPKADDRKSYVETPPNDNTINAFGTHKFFVQANAMSNKAIAEQIAADLSEKTRRDWFIVFEDNLYKVRLGYFESKDEAKYIVGTLNTPDISYYVDEVPEGKSEY
jgi:cell division protein FtsN